MVEKTHGTHDIGHQVHVVDQHLSQAYICMQENAMEKGEILVNISCSQALTYTCT